MKILAAAVVLVFVIGSLAFLKARASKPTAKADPKIYPEMRHLALSGSRTDFGLVAPASSDEPWGVVMDTTFPDGGSYTVVAMKDGNASIYLSSGGGFIGGFSHEAIKKAAKALVQAAEQYRQRMSQTQSFPLPAPGYTTFYVRTDAGVYSVTTPTQELGEQRSRFSPLFYAAQNVITQYRLISPK